MAPSTEMLEVHPCCAAFFGECVRTGVLMEQYPMKNQLTRRQMLSRTAQAAAVLAISQTPCPLFAAPGSRGFKIGACDWSLGRNDPSCMQIAREIGLDGVQVSMGSAGDHLKMRQSETREAYLKAAKENKVEVASLALSETNNVPLFSEPRAAIWLLDSIAVCQALNVKVVLIACFAKGELRADDKSSIDRVTELLKEIAPRAEKAGVILGLENYMSAEANLSIIDRVGSPSVQVYYDVGNSTDKGYDILKEIRLLGKRICEFHAKDAGNMLGKGRIDFKQVRAAMDDIDYRGWIQIEAAAPHSIVEDYRADLNYLRGIFPA
jgi:L-ribulose-5-phosphate 3-epimerase